MAQCLFICDVNLSIEENLSIILLKEYDLKTHIKGYHAYMIKWTPKMEIFSKLDQNQRTSLINMQSQLKDGLHLFKGRSARFLETVLYFLRASNKNCCRVEVTRKRVNLRSN